MKESFGVQLLGEKSFIHYNALNFTNNLFSKLFGKDMKLLSYATSAGGMGYFILKYQFIPKNYIIVFEHDRLFFTIRLSKPNGAFTHINNISGNKIDTALEDKNISYAVRILREALNNGIPEFYRLKQDRLVRDEED